MEIVFDTSILIDHLRNLNDATELVFKVEQKRIVGYISSLTESELVAGKECDNKGKRKLILKLISIFNKIDVTNEIAQKAGDFKRKYGISLDDCIIAATAFYKKCRLWTKNKKDFEKIKEIEVEEPY